MFTMGFFVLFFQVYAANLWTALALEGNLQMSRLQSVIVSCEGKVECLLYTKYKVCILGHSISHVVGRRW